jgi:hypothetical protein
MSAPADGTWPSVVAGEHRHHWNGVDFLVVDGRPFVRQTCDCGAERRFRAFERFWDPGTEPGPSPQDPDP